MPKWISCITRIPVDRQLIVESRTLWRGDSSVVIDVHGRSRGHCGYSIPHPSDGRVNIRVQTTGDSAREVFKDSCQDLMQMSEHVRSSFDQAIMEFKSSKGLISMNIKQ